MLSNYQRSTILVGAVCLAVPLFFAQAAAAPAYERCDPNGNYCYRCVDDGTCRRDRDFDRDYFKGSHTWICDEDGANCEYRYDRSNRDDD